MINRCLMLLVLLCWPALPLQAADADLYRLGEQLKSEGRVGAGLLPRMEQTADGLFLLGWLYEHGRYGVAANPDRARHYYQQAAERGQMDAAHYCWQRCLELTPAFVAALEQAGAASQPQALYLRSKWLAAQGGAALAQADQLLVAAARARQPDAISELYIQHFLNWSNSRRSFPAAEAKLKRCTDEGVGACYLLLALLYQRHGYAEQALLHYLILQQLDEGLAGRYLSAAQRQALEQRLPADSLAIVQSHVATRLATHPRTGFDRLDRFRVCATTATFACIRRVAQQDSACMAGYFASTYLFEFRKTTAYRRCLGL